jgi:plasmid stability protein
MPQTIKRAQTPTGITLATWLPPREAENLRARAAAADRSIAAEIRRALRLQLQNDERRAEGPDVVQESPGRGRHDEE